MAMANVGKDLLQVPFPEMVKAMATGIAEAQFALDMTSLKIAKLMSGADEPNTQEGDKGKNLVAFGGGRYSLLELGFTPTFYQFVDTIIEIKMSISMSQEESQATSRFDMDSEAGFEAGLGFLSARGKASLESLDSERLVRIQVPVQRRRLEPACAPSSCRCRRRLFWKSAFGICWKRISHAENPPNNKDHP